MITLNTNSLTEALRLADNIIAELDTLILETSELSVRIQLYDIRNEVEALKTKIEEVQGYAY